MADVQFQSGFIPSRHGAHRAEARKLLGTLRLLVPNSEPTPERWQAMGEHLMRGDEPMDRLVEWMFEVGMAKTRPLYEQAVERGIDSVSEAPEPLRRFFALVENRPPWVDAEQLRFGARVYQRGSVELIYVARDVAFMGGYQASAFNQTLLLTGAMKKGPSRRFAETLQWALDCTQDGGMAPFGPGYRSTLRVRLIHGIVRRHVQKMPQWRMEEWGLPINQTDMIATLLGVVTVPILGVQVLGMPMTARERDAATHHGRYVGWLMGIEEQWLPRDNREALALLYHLLLSITNPDETSVQLAQPMMDEPFHRPYPQGTTWRPRYARALHLSVTRAFLGRKGMRNLGLPENTLPWYPVVNFPFFLGRQIISRLVPKGLEWQARAGRRAQDEFLRLLTGALPAHVGQAAAHIAQHD